MGTTIGDYVGTNIGIHSPIPHYEPDSKALYTLKPESYNLPRSVMKRISPFPRPGT